MRQGPFRGTLVRALADAWTRIALAVTDRRAMRQLSDLTDRELRDIGLLRQDMLDAGALGRDAITLLRQRRHEQRGRLRGAGGGTPWHRGIC